MSFMKRILAFFGCAILCVGLYVAYSQVSGGGFDDTIKYIQRHIGSRGQLQDVQDDIGIDSIEDLKWYDLGKKVEIEYGKIKLKIKKEDLFKQETLNKLKTVYIDVKYYKEAQQWKFYYRGAEIGKYVK